MNRAERLLGRTDPARHLDPMLDERAETDLAALVGTVPSATPRPEAQLSSPRRKRLQPVLITGLVAVAVTAGTVAVISNGPAQPAAGGKSISSTSVTPAASFSPLPTTSTSPTSAPAGIYSGPLIALDGARSWTREQLHARLAASPGPDDPATAAIGEEQDWLDIQCMAKKGYLYDPTIDGTSTVEPGKTYGLTAKQHKQYLAAFWGPGYPDTTEPYDWRTAGCHGQSVHLTGQDDAH